MVQVTMKLVLKSGMNEDGNSRDYDRIREISAMLTTRTTLAF